MTYTYPSLPNTLAASGLTKRREMIDRRLATQPKEVIFCKKCVVSNQRPRIQFDQNGVCGACKFAFDKHHVIDWNDRGRQLKDLCDRHRRTDGRHDVIVPSSGGKDSAYVAHQLKHHFGMHPLTVTWAPHIYTDIGWQNFNNFIHAGFDNVTGYPNGKVHRILTALSFEHLGDPFQPFIYGAKAFPLRVATQYDIPLVMYGENGEVEYGGDMKNQNSPTHNLSDDMVKHYFSGVPADYWHYHGIATEDLTPYLPPAAADLERVGVQAHFFGYYKKWIPRDIFHYASEHTGFRPNPDGRSEGTYTEYASLDDRIDGFHYYLGFIKFGIGRCTSDAAHEIRDGQISREEGVSWVRRFDGEFPAKYFQDFLSYTGLSERFFWEVVDSFRPLHLWEEVDGEWKLKHQVL
jgi:N-acetyl sugar amidotransferase